MIELLEATLQPDPAKRLTARQLLQLPYFDNVVKTLPKLAAINPLAYSEGEVRSQDLFLHSDTSHTMFSEGQKGKGTLFTAWPSPPPPAMEMCLHSEALGQCMGLPSVMQLPPIFRLQAAGLAPQC